MHSKQHSPGGRTRVSPPGDGGREPTRGPRHGTRRVPVVLTPAPKLPFRGDEEAVGGA